MDSAACPFGNFFGVDVADDAIGVDVADDVVGAAATGSTTDRWDGSLVGMQLARSVSLCYKQTSSFVLTFAVTKDCPEVQEAAPTFTWCVDSVGQCMCIDSTSTACELHSTCR